MTVFTSPRCSRCRSVLKHTHYRVLPRTAPALRSLGEDAAEFCEECYGLMERTLDRQRFTAYLVTPVPRTSGAAWHAEKEKIDG